MREVESFMDLNSVINNDKINHKIRNIYKTIEKNTDNINEIFNRTFEDIKIIFSNATMNSNTIEILNNDIHSIMEKRNECHDILSHHADDVLDAYSYLIPFVFRINVVKDTITISKKY